MRVPKAPQRPLVHQHPPAAAPSTPVRLHPTTIIDGVLEMARRDGHEDQSLAAAAAVTASPSKVKESPKRRRALPALNPDLRAAAAAGSAALAAQ